MDNQQDPTGVTNERPESIPEYRRYIYPRNLVLSAENIGEICQLVSTLNDSAIELEKSSVVTEEEQRSAAHAQIDELMRIQYSYTEENGNYVVGTGLPDVSSKQFPEGLRNFYVSNTGYSLSVVQKRPLNCVDVYIDFSPPNFWVDLTSAPSNPTPNKSEIDIYGRDESWVISANTRMNELLNTRQNWISSVHGAGKYDQFTYVFYIPLLVVFVLYLGIDSSLKFLDVFSFPLKILISLWLIVLSLMFGRQLFQYFRWLIPPVEYYKSKRKGAHAHRLIILFIFGGLFVAALYDLLKGFFRKFQCGGIEC